MGPASVTVTKTNLSLAPGGTEMLEAKVNYDDGSSDYNYRVVFSREGVASVRHSGSEIMVIGGKTGGDVLLKVISNKNPAIVAEVKVLVAGFPSPLAGEGGRPPATARHERAGRPDEGASVPIKKLVPNPYEVSSSAAYIDQLYLEVLHRPADAVGKTYWTKMLDRGLYTKEEVRAAFLGSV